MRRLRERIQHKIKVSHRRRPIENKSLWYWCARASHLYHRARAFVQRLMWTNMWTNCLRRAYMLTYALEYRPENMSARVHIKHNTYMYRRRIMSAYIHTLLCVLPIAFLTISWYIYLRAYTKVLKPPQDLLAIFSLYVYAYTSVKLKLIYTMVICTNLYTARLVAIYTHYKESYIFINVLFLLSHTKTLSASKSPTRGSSRIENKKLP